MGKQTIFGLLGGSTPQVTPATMVSPSRVSKKSKTRRAMRLLQSSKGWKKQTSCRMAQEMLRKKTHEALKCGLKFRLTNIQFACIYIYKHIWPYMYIIHHSYILNNQRCRIGFTKQTKTTARQNHIPNRLYI